MPCPSLGCQSPLPTKSDNFSHRKAIKLQTPRLLGCICNDIAMQRQGSGGVGGFLNQMSMSGGKNAEVAARRAEFEAMKLQKKKDRAGHEAAREKTKELEEKFGEYGIYKEWTIVFDPASGHNYYYNNFSGACVWEEPEDFAISAKSGRPIAAIKLWAARKMQAVFRGKQGRLKLLAVRGEGEWAHTEVHDHGDWVESFDPHHQSKYYYNHKTHAVQWDPPEGWVSKPPPVLNQLSFAQGVNSVKQDYSKAAPVRMWRPRAATKIQSVYRGHLARRHVHAIRENKRLVVVRAPKKKDILPPDQDFLSAGSAAREEMSRLTKLLKQNNDRVKKMEETISNHSHVVEVKDAKIAQLKKRLESEVEEVASLERRLEQEEHDFEEIVKLTKSKEKEIEDKNVELTLQLEKITTHEKELDRHKTIIRRQEKQIDVLNPDTEDVCLSARSFSENMIISLRDEAIEAKEKQIALLNGQNEGLLANLESLESEIHNMQKDLLEKEKIIAKKQRYGEHLEHKIDKLERDLQKKGGEEAAIEVTNRQNAQLLQLLQVHETKTEELEAIKKDLEEQIKSTTERHEALMRQAAEWEAKNVQLEAESVEMKKKLSTGAITWEGQRAHMEVELEETKKAARVRIDAMQEELRTRREKQYSLLERLQAAEESMRSSEDECERLRETVNIVQERMYELDAQLIQAKQWRVEDQTSGKGIELKYKGIIAERENEIKRHVEQNNGLKKQLQEMAATVLNLVDKNKEADDSHQKSKENELQVQSQVETLEERIAGLLKEATREGKARVEAENTVNILHEQMNVLRKENKRLLEAAQCSAVERDQQESTVRQRVASLKASLTGERRARRNAVARIIDRRITTQDELDERVRRDPKIGSTVDLSNIGLTDDDSVMITPLFGKEALLARRFETLNLSYNRLGDDGAKHLANLIRSGTFLRTINISGNTISGDGIRHLAEAVSGCSALGIRHVYVHKDGKVQGLGERSKAWINNSVELSSDENKEVKEAPSSAGEDSEARTAETVLTVDVRNNVAPEFSVITPYEIKRPKKLPVINNEKEVKKNEKKTKDDKFLKRVYGTGEKNEALLPISKAPAKAVINPASPKNSKPTKKKSFFSRK